VASLNELKGKVKEMVILASAIVIIVMMSVTWCSFSMVRSWKWSVYAKLRLADNFWRVLDAGEAFSDAILDQFARDLTEVSKEVLSEKLFPVEYPSDEFVEEARKKLLKKLNTLATDRHFKDKRQPENYAVVAEHLNAYIGVEVFKRYGSWDYHYWFTLNRNFVEQYIRFKASGLSSVKKPIPASPYFPLDYIPKLFWNDSLTRYRELSESGD